MLRNLLLLFALIGCIACSPKRRASAMPDTPITVEGRLYASKGGPMLILENESSYTLLGLQSEAPYLDKRVKVVGIPQSHSGTEADLRDSTGAYSQGRVGTWETLQVQSIEIVGD